MSLPLFGPAQLLQGVVQFSLSPFVHAVLVHAVSLPSRLVQPGLSKDPRRKRRGFNKEGLCYVGGICPPNPLTRMPFLPTASSGASWHHFVKRISSSLIPAALSRCFCLTIRTMRLRCRLLGTCKVRTKIFLFLRMCSLNSSISSGARQVIRQRWPQSQS